MLAHKLYQHFFNQIKEFFNIDSNELCHCIDLKMYIIKGNPNHYLSKEKNYEYKLWNFKCRLFKTCPYSKISVKIHSNLYQ